MSETLVSTIEPKNAKKTFGELLGSNVDYPQQYNPELLFAIARKTYRQTLEGFNVTQTMHGVDRWNCYELSWLNEKGKPKVACAYIEVAANSPFIVESKSLKLYLNSLNQHCFASVEVMQQTVEQDLRAAVQADVTLSIFDVEPFSQALNQHSSALLLDTLDIDCSYYQREPSLLKTLEINVSDETLYSHLLRSNCPVTNQPDWATVSVRYSGSQINRASLLAYIVSYRQHSGFHEQCVEQIFFDILQCCKPLELCVAAQYTRRGGIDINPIRSTQAQWPVLERVNRQ